MRLKLIFFAVVVIPTVALADISKVEADRAACLERAVANNEMKQCEFAASNQAEIELNKIYTEIKAELARGMKNRDPHIAAENKEVNKRLLHSQHVWLAFRQANCSLAGVPMLGGTAEGLLMAGCISEATIARVKELISVFSKEDI